MTADEFWNGSPFLAQAYMKSHNLITERKNHESWLVGYYCYVGVEIALHNAFRKKGAKTKQYIEPFRVTKMTALEKEIKIDEERKKAVDHFTRWGEMVKAAQKRKKGGG